MSGSIYIYIYIYIYVCVAYKLNEMCHGKFEVFGLKLPHIKALPLLYTKC